MCHSKENGNWVQQGLKVENQLVTSTDIQLLNAHYASLKKSIGIVGSILYNKYRQLNKDIALPKAKIRSDIGHVRNEVVALPPLAPAPAQPRPPLHFFHSFF